MLEVRDLTVRYGDHLAVRDLDLDVAAGRTLVVLGPSGCGKSTLLRAIAGLEPHGGTIRVDGRDLAGRRPDQRGVSLMFQEHVLFPHRDVAANVGFGPRMRGLARDAVAERVREALALVDLAGFEHRPVTELSGGERQRVALARAIAPRPRLLLLDEPLGSLDRVLRDWLLEQLPQVVAAVGATVVHVTHDHDEALALADQVAVMRAGEVVQSGAPDDLWRRPTDAFVARFLGLRHLLDVEVRDGTATSVFGRLARPDLPTGDARLVLLPDALRLTDDLRPPAGEELAVRGRVRRRRFAGDHVVVQVATDAGPVVDVPVWKGVGPPVDQLVILALDPAALHPVG
jgi:thiamine transport system ATP-binding protein